MKAVKVVNAIVQVIMDVIVVKAIMGIQVIVKIVTHVH